MESMLCVQVLDSHHCDITFCVMDVKPHGTVDRYRCAATVGCCSRPEKCHPLNGECVSIRNNVNMVTVDRPAGVVCTVLCKNKHYLNVGVFFLNTLL